MSGVVFIVCIPCENYEQAVQKESKKRVTIDERPKLIARSRTEEFLSRIVDHESHGYGKRDKGKENLSMEKILHQILNDLHVKNSTWCKGDKDNYLQVIFSVDSTDRCDEILEILKENQIGQKYDSIVNVLPCTIQYHGPQQQSECSEEQDLDHEDKTTAWHRFLSSVRARLTVAQVVENVKVHAALTFDFIFLILVSTIMCAIGLGENSNVYLLSSMVICPMMGPVMAGTFGSVIQHKKLMTIGVQNELIGLGIATVVGFCYGSLICSIADKVEDGNQQWPTYEMISRGEPRSLWVGCLIALLSGAVVALGILSDNIASLVGVAISTSLTPPAVNAGLFWSMASVYYLKGYDFETYKNRTHQFYYSKEPIEEFLALGAVSLCLTFVNIVCIYAAGIIVFKIKEVAPMSVRDYAGTRFWQHDIKIARDYNRTIGNEQGSCMISTLTEELANYHRQGYHDQMCHSTEVTKDESKINTIKRSEYTWSPCMNFPMHSNIRELNELYDKLIKGAAQKATVSKGQRYRRLSQIFERDDDKLVTISETNHGHLSDLSGNSVSQHAATGKKKFVVTPCKTDPLLK